MSPQEGEASLRRRFLTSIEVLTPWWSDHLRSLQCRYFPAGSPHSAQRQIDLMLSGIALGASRWARTSQALTRERKKLEPCCNVARQHFNAEELKVREIVQSLAGCVQRGAAQSTADARFEGDMAAMVVTIQLGAIQCAASDVFSVLYSAEAVLETLRLLLLDELPSRFHWCA